MGYKMKKEKREIKFKCPHGGSGTGHNCHALGCIHLINNSCPIYRRQHLEVGKDDKENRLL